MEGYVELTFVTNGLLGQKCGYENGLNELKAGNTKKVPTLYKDNGKKTYGNPTIVSFNSKKKRMEKNSAQY